MLDGKLIPANLPAYNVPAENEKRFTFILRGDAMQLIRAI